MQEVKTMNVIDVHNLHKRYGAHTAVEDVSFTVSQGEIFGILGPNGAGKTTTVECVGGLRVPDRGRVSVLNLDPRRDRKELRKRVGIQLQESALPERIKVWEALALFSSFYERPADWKRMVEAFGLTEKQNAVYGKLSGGQKQRLSIALALVGRPEIAILDELTTGLDPQARLNTWEVIRSVRDQGTTILLVTHSMEEAAQLCDRLAVINGGRVIAVDSPAGLVKRVNGAQSIRFRPSAPLDEQLLAGLPGVHSVQRSGEQIQVTGGGNLLGVVSAFLHQREITALELRLEQATLNDAFLALTGRGLEDEANENP